MKTIANMEAAYELELYAVNESKLYHGQTLNVIENLHRKYIKGQYDKEKAVKAWSHVAEAAAKMYHKEFGGGCSWFDVFNKATRHETAKALEAYYLDDVQA